MHTKKAIKEKNMNEMLKLSEDGKVVLEADVCLELRKEILWTTCQKTLQS